MHISERQQSEKAIHYMIPAVYRTCTKRQNYGHSEKISAWGWGWGREMSRWSIEDFWGSENTLYDIVLVDTQHKFVKTHRMDNTKREPGSKLDCV